MLVSGDLNVNRYFCSIIVKVLTFSYWMQLPSWHMNLGPPDGSQVGAGVKQ